MTVGDLPAKIGLIGILAQLGGEMLLVTLFLLLRRFVLRRGYFTAWLGAWMCGVVAIAALSARYFLMAQPERPTAEELTYPVLAMHLVYQVGKLSSFALFVSGSAMYVTGSRLLGPRNVVFVVAMAYALVSMLGSGGVLGQLVVWQAPLAVVAMGACAALFFTLPRSRRTLGSLAGGTTFGALAALWLVYGLAFGLSASARPLPLTGLIVDFNPYFDLMLNIALGFAMVVLLMEDAKREVDDAQAELRVQHDQLRRAALYDTLTDSLNRRAFAQGVGLEMARGTFGTVVIADLDNLKAVNDAHGHGAGDQLLRLCADMLRGTLRPYDKLYRWGGDEFLLVIPSARAMDVEVRLTEVLGRAEPIEVGSGGARVKLEVSLGAADYTSAEGLEESIDLADQAMYRQKHARKSPDVGMRAVNLPSRSVAIKY